MVAKALRDYLLENSLQLAGTCLKFDSDETNISSSWKVCFTFHGCAWFIGVAMKRHREVKSNRFERKQNCLVLFLL